MEVEEFIQKLPESYFKSFAKINLFAFRLVFEDLRSVIEDFDFAGQLEENGFINPKIIDVPFLTIREASNLLNIEKKTLLQAAKAGRLVCEKMPIMMGDKEIFQYLLSIESINNYLSGNRKKKHLLKFLENCANSGQ